MKPTENALEVEVVNFWPNRIIGDQFLPLEQRFTRTNIRKLSKETPLMESGLLGPVQLMVQPSTAEAGKKYNEMPYRILFVTGLFLLGARTAAGPGSSPPQEMPLPTESDFQGTRPAPDWANRVMANDPKVRATAEAALVQGAGRSLPLLRRFLNGRNEDLHPETFEIIRRIGPAAIPLLAEMLRG